MADLRTLLELRQAYPLSWSRDGSWLLVASDLSGTRQLYRLWTAGGELEQLTSYDEPVDGQLLPDDRLLLEIDEGGNERTQLYLDGDPLVVDPRYIHRSPHVSRDGALLAYATNRRNGLDFDIVVRRLESGEERSFELGGLCSSGEISPDGRWVIAGQAGDLSGDSNLFLLGIETGEVVHVTPHEGQAEYLDPIWLPDSSGFLCATNEGRDTFAISLADLDGELYGVGDHEQLFALQSISKVFVYSLALADCGRDHVLQHVGVEPTGEAFNSILLNEHDRRPYNPMVNAGAIVAASMVRGKDTAEKVDRIVEVMRLFLFAILLGFPVLEAVVLVRLSQTLGWWVLAWMVLAAVAGMALIKEARLSLVARLAAGFAQGRFSIVALTDSARTVLAGFLLIYPGVVSDLIALTLLLLPGPRFVETTARRERRGTFIEGDFRRTR